MKIQEYHPETGALLQDSATGVTFGTLLRANYCEHAVVLKPVATSEASISEMKVFLKSRGPLTEAEFGFGSNASLITGVEPGSSSISQRFTGVASGSALALPDGHYAWLDVKAGHNETGAASFSYGFLYEYH